MKRLLILVSAALLASQLHIAHVSAQSPSRPVRVFLDGLSVAFDVQPVIKDGRTLVPFRALAEALSLDVKWDGEKQIVTARDARVAISLRIGDNTAHRNGLPVSLDVPPLIIDGRTLVPLRFFSEAFGCKVIWDDTAWAVRMSSPVKSMYVTGFYALGDARTSSWRNLFGRDYPDTGSERSHQVSELALGWFSLDRQGNLLTRSASGWQRPEGWHRVLETAHSRNIRTEMVVHLVDGDGTLTHILTDTAARTQVLWSIVQEARTYHGVNLDFEGLGWKTSPEEIQSVRNSFTSFVRDLATGLHSMSKTLTLTLHPPNSVYQGYDYKALGEAADRIIIMAYDYGSRPEPTDLVLQAVEAAKEMVPRHKLLLGISVPSEDAESLVAKIGIAKRHGLYGIALWRLGLITEEMWEAMSLSIEALRP